MKKILVLVLCVCMLLPCFAGCGNLEPEETPGQPVVGDGPEDLNGKEFTVPREEIYFLSEFPKSKIQMFQPQPTILSVLP